MTLPTTESMARASEQRAEEAEQSPYPAFLRIGKILVWIVWALVLVTALMLLLAFFLRLGGANPDAGFVRWVEDSVDQVMSPFRGIFPEHDLGGDSVLDMSLLFAALVYFVVALLVDFVLRWLTLRLRRQEHVTARLRAEADVLARQAASEHHAAEVAVQQAAARELARQQLAAEQYATARAAAHEVVTQQAAQDRLVPPPPTTPTTGAAPGATQPLAPTEPPAG